MKKFIERYLNTKRKKNIIGSLVVILLLGCIGVYVLTKNNSTLILTTNSINVELGQVVSTDVSDYLDYNKVDKKIVSDIVKNAETKNNFEYVVIESKDENGNIISKEEKDYPKVGNYKIDFSYKKENKTIKVEVVDTTAPIITAPDTIDVIQFTDLSTFNFAELLQVTDYSDVNDWSIDISNVDVNTVGQYKIKLSINDVAKNKAEKDMKINIIEAPAVAEGEVAVTEIVIDENGNKKTVITKKASNQVSDNDHVTTGKPVENKNDVTINGGNTSTKPNGNSGSTSGNAGGNNGDSKPDKPVHSHNWQAVTTVVHHDAETKTVHHEAVTKTETVTVVDKEAYDEPIYESRYICNRCDFSTKDGREIGDHIVDVCGGGYHVGKVQTGIKHHDAVTHQENRTVVVKEAWDEVIVTKPAWNETKITGYKCSCGATK